MEKNLLKKPNNVRRFNPEPLEVSSRTNKSRRVGASDPSPALHESSSSLPQLQPVNNDQISEQESKGSKPTRAARRFRPEPVESVKLSRRQPVEGLPTSLALGSGPRKFSPQLVETGKRSFRRPESAQDEAASSSGGNLPHFTDQPSQAPVSIIPEHPVSASENVFNLPTESRFSYASLLQRQEGRSHSFRVPDLPAIPSNSSEDSSRSNSPSLSTSPSTSSQEYPKTSAVKDQSRESCDERFSNYLLSLAAQSAEKQLREQALAAFPNEQIHQPVSHFAIDGDEDSENEDHGAAIPMPLAKAGQSTFRRESTTDLSWELEEMRRHKEVAELKDRGWQSRADHESRFSAAAIAARQSRNNQPSKPVLGGWQKNLELAQMRHAASPPMLGHDIVFPMSSSPQGTSCETEEICISVQEPGNWFDGQLTGLWTASSHNENEAEAGLWMGLCRKDGFPTMNDSSRIRPGIVTPNPDVDGQLYLSLDGAAKFSPNNQVAGKSPTTDSPFDHVDRRLRFEKEIEHEFDDSFVSQVYDYLSLGYPSLARYYDHELSKISGIPIEELRKDDLHADPRGYVGVHGRSGFDESGTSFDRCMRWTALRLYIQEWARQQPAMPGNDDDLGAWGVRERRGSWAI